MSKVDYAVVIGRFQPFHNGHLELIKKAMAIANNVIVVVGSAYAARNAKNPFTFQEREKMIRAGVYQSDEGKDFQGSLHIIGVSDFFYNENRWFEHVRIKVYQIVSQSDSVVLVGHKRDASSYYLNRFQGWAFREVGTLHADLNATKIREVYFQDIDLGWEEQVPPTSKSFLDEFYKTGTYRDLQDEFLQILHYRQQWTHAPYPPTFVTTDAVVHKSGYILLVRRKDAPGRGLWALPGGFLGISETLEQSSVRELIEETGIRMLPQLLLGSIKESQVFDYPERSLRGRVITHAFLYDLGEGLLPPVNGQDDAIEARWFTTNELFTMQDQMFEDHFSIIQYFVAKL